MQHVPNQHWLLHKGFLMCPHITSGPAASVRILPVLPPVHHVLFLLQFEHTSSMTECCASYQQQCIFSLMVQYKETSRDLKTVAARC